jgi:hypothetical protein
MSPKSKKRRVFQHYVLIRGKKPKTGVRTVSTQGWKQERNFLHS